LLPATSLTNVASVFDDAASVAEIKSFALPFQSSEIKHMGRAKLPRESPLLASYRYAPFDKECLPRLLKRTSLVGGCDKQDYAVLFIVGVEG
jgi:hypothetical protein